MRYGTALVTTLAAFMLGAAPAAAQESIVGTWEIVENWGHNPQAGEWRNDNIQPSLYLFNEDHYSIAYVGGDEARPLLPDEATRTDLNDEQVAAVWLPYVSNTGTYEFDGQSLTTHPIVALWPNFMEGGSATYTIKFEGDTVVLMQSGEDWSWNVRLRRVQ